MGKARQSVAIIRPEARWNSPKEYNELNISQDEKEHYTKTNDKTKVFEIKMIFELFATITVVGS